MFNINNHQIVDLHYYYPNTPVFHAMIKHEQEINSLYEKIKNLNVGELDTFRKQNLLPLTRFKPNLLQKLVNDKSIQPKQKTTFDKLFTEEFNQKKELQSTGISRLSQSLSINDNLKILDYINELITTENNVKFASYHLAINIMRHLSDEQSTKRTDYLLQSLDGNIPNEVTNKLINNIERCVDITNSYEEQVIVIDYLYQNQLDIQDLHKIINKQNQLVEWIDVLIDKDCANYNKKPDELKETARETDKKRILHFCNLFEGQFESNTHDLFINELSNKINAIQKTKTKHGLSGGHSEEFYKIIQPMSDTIDNRMQWLCDMKDTIIASKIINLAQQYDMGTLQQLNNEDEIKQKLPNKNKFNGW